MAQSREYIEYLNKLKAELKRIMTFWLHYSHDEENGGFFNCVYEDGRIYDDTKYCWLQGRQVWMYCKLYNECESFQKKEILEVALKGIKFMQKHFKRVEDGRCYFSTTADGKPVKLQRTIFSECFYCMALLQAAKATKNEEYKNEALKEFAAVLEWIEGDNLPSGRPKLEGAERQQSLAVPMMILCVAQEIAHCFPKLANGYLSHKLQAVKMIKKHLQRNGTVVLETVSDDGKELSGSSGRLINPGHAIETGWFLLQFAVEINDEELKNLAIEKFILESFKLAWDERYGGLFYFMDADGYSPVQLEWNLKLWWPQCEAMIAFLMAFKITGNNVYFDIFKQVFDYTFSKFPDYELGEWFGYLSQKGTVTHNFKGGPFKGCFHVPRALHMCSQMLNDIVNG